MSAAVAVSCFSRQAEYCGYAASLAQSRCACRRPVRDKCEASREYSSRCVPAVASLAISSHSAASASRTFASQQERQLTAPRYQIGPPAPERPGTVPSHPQSPTTRGGTVREAAATEATFKRETSA